MAGGGDADRAAVLLRLFAAHARHDLTALDTDARLGHHRTRRVDGLRLHDHMDRPVPVYQSHSAQGQERLIYATSLNDIGAKNPRPHNSRSNVRLHNIESST